MIDQMLFEHEAPPLYDSQQGLLEGTGIDTKPHVKHCSALDNENIIIMCVQ